MNGNISRLPAQHKPIFLTTLLTAFV